MENNRLKKKSLDEMIDMHIGKRGTEKREAFEEELRLDILGQTIKQIRKEKHLTQAQLGELIGVKKAQISKIENNLTDARFETILKVFRALNAKINFKVEFLNQNVTLGQKKAERTTMYMVYGGKSAKYKHFNNKYTSV